MSKELFIAAHEELIEQYLLDHPEATEAQAYDATVNDIYDCYTDKLAGMVDAARDRAKYR